MTTTPARAASGCSTSELGVLVASALQSAPGRALQDEEAAGLLELACGLAEEVHERAALELRGAVASHPQCPPELRRTLAVEAGVRAQLVETASDEELVRCARDADREVRQAALRELIVRSQAAGAPTDELLEVAEALVAAGARYGGGDLGEGLCRGVALPAELTGALITARTAAGRGTASEAEQVERMYADQCNHGLLEVYPWLRFAAERRWGNHLHELSRVRSWGREERYRLLRALVRSHPGRVLELAQHTWECWGDMRGEIRTLCEPHLGLAARYELSSMGWGVLPEAELLAALGVVGKFSEAHAPSVAHARAAVGNITAQPSAVAWYVHLTLEPREVLAARQGDREFLSAWVPMLREEGLCSLLGCPGGEEAAVIALKGNSLRKRELLHRLAGLAPEVVARADASLLRGEMREDAVAQAVCATLLEITRAGRGQSLELCELASGSGSLRETRDIVVGLGG